MPAAASHQVSHMFGGSSSSAVAGTAAHLHQPPAYPTPALSSAFSLSSSSFTQTSYLPSFTLALFSSPGTTPTTASTSVLFEASPAGWHPTPHEPHQSSSHLNVSSLFSLVTVAHQELSGYASLDMATAAASTSVLHNDTLEDAALATSLFDNLDASLYLGLNSSVIMAIILGAISLFTIIGNVLVIWAIFSYRPLHNVQNMYMVSLAVADIAVAVLVMPLNVAYNLMGRWIFGLHLCEMWLTSDVLCCTASILNLCAIALDRYWAIHDPINYAQKRTMRRVCTSIGIVWILSALISIPPLIGWNDWPEVFDENTPCKLSEEKSYLIYSSSGSFFIPLFIMIVVYFKIFKATRRRLKDRAKASAMANLGRGGPTMTTVSTPVIVNATNHKEHITKSSSNDDSSSSGSPKVSHTFGNLKQRCTRCCRSSKTSDKDDGMGRGRNGKSAKALRKAKSSLVNKEARIEIESASDDMDHSKNEVSSSDAFGMTSGGALANGQQAAHGATTNGLGSPVADGTAAGVSSLASTPASAAVSSNDAHHSTVHCSASVSGDCRQASPPAQSPHLNGAFGLGTTTSAPTSSSVAIIDSTSSPHQFAYVCTCNNGDNGRAPSSEPIGYIEAYDSNAAKDHVKASQMYQDLDANSRLLPPQRESHNSNRQVPIDTSLRDAPTNGHVSLEQCVHRSTANSLPPHQTGSIASVSNMTRPELSSSTAITTTVSHSKTVIIPAPTVPPPTQTISVKKMWEERQKISLSRERRATRILLIVNLAFVCCWLPFFIMYILPVMPFCNPCYLPRELETFITWLGYINSALNPAIYAGFNRDFRRAFQRILSCKKI